MRSLRLWRARLMHIAHPDSEAHLAPCSHLRANNCSAGLGKHFHGIGLMLLDTSRFRMRKLPSVTTYN